MTKISSFFLTALLISVAISVTPAAAENNTSSTSTSPLMMFLPDEFDHESNSEQMQRNKTASLNNNNSSQNISLLFSRTTLNEHGMAKPQKKADTVDPVYSEDCWREYEAQQNQLVVPSSPSFPYGMHLLSNSITKTLGSLVGLRKPEQEKPILPLENFRNYALNSAHEGTHAAILSDGRVIPIPQTWQAQTLHTVLGNPHALTSEQFSQSLSAVFGNKIASWAYSPELQKNAAVRHTDVLTQQLLAGILKNVVHTLNPHLKDIKIKVVLPEKKESTSTEEQPTSIAATDNNANTLPPSSSTRGISSSSFLPSFSLNQSVINPIITSSLAHALSVAPGLVNAAFKQEVLISVALNENALVKIGGVSHALINEVLNKVDGLFLQNIDRASKAAKAIKKLKLLLRAQHYEKAISATELTNLLKAYQKTLYLTPSSHSLAGEAQKLLQEHPINLLLTKAASRKFNADLAGVLSLPQKLEEIKNLFPIPNENLSSPILSSSSSSSSSSSKSPNAKTSVDEEQLFLQALQTYHNQSNEIAQQAHTAAQEARKTLEQMSELITQSILPSSHSASKDQEEVITAGGGSVHFSKGEASLQNLEPSLERLTETLKLHLKTIEEAVEKTDQLKTELLIKIKTYVTAMETRSTEVHKPTTFSNITAKNMRDSYNTFAGVAKLQRLSSQSQIKKSDFEIAQKRSQKIKAILAGEYEEEDQDTYEEEGRNNNANNISINRMKSVIPFQNPSNRNSQYDAYSDSQYDSSDDSEEFSSDEDNESDDSDSNRTSRLYQKSPWKNRPGLMTIKPNIEK